MTATRSRIDELMEAASQALVAMDYLVSEARCLEALDLARSQEDWDYYARILLPLQECRRQRRIIAAEGAILLGAAQRHGEPADWLDAIPRGCILLKPPHTRKQARTLELSARHHRLHVEVLFGQASADGHWSIQGPAGPAVSVLRPAAPSAAVNRLLDADSDPALRREAADWFIDASEALGDAALAAAGAADGTIERIEQLEAALQVFGDHEILHQRLADAARAMARKVGA